MSLPESAADSPLAHTQWITSPSDVEAAMAESGIYQPTRQASRGVFKAGLATRKIADGELFSDRYNTAISVHCKPPEDGIAILLPRSPSGHFVVNGGERSSNLLAWTVSLIGHASEQFRPEKINGNAAQHKIAKNTQEFIEMNFEESVTDIALRCGFTHLGRFSVAYRTRFGESPSETLITPTGVGDF